MGIDAHIRFSLPFTLDENILQEKSSFLKEAFGEDYGICFSKNGYFDTELEEGHATWYSVGTGLDRYYGKGYERGPITKLLTIISWIRTTFPQANIYYGGDDFESLLTIQEQRKLWEHYVRFGERPYRRDYNDKSNVPENKPVTARKEFPEKFSQEKEVKDE